MNWLNLKRQIQGLGFETSSVLTDEDYKYIIIDASNRAVEVIRQTIVARFADYFTDHVDIETGQLNDITAIDVDTLDDFEIEIPKKLLMLVPLLAAHYVWLDDDVQKAITYWNEYDSLKNELIIDCNRNRNLKFSGGI
ncbi:MAG: hypothetical protein GX857_00875 [Bacteroidales bacterium]|nr:hypothetical protein [Bacteroidales bacterium]